MASDTGTLELERVHEARRRLEGERDGGRVALGPEDQAAADELGLDLDPATRAARIVQEVLASAADTSSDPVLPPAGEGPAAARARRIVEEVLAAAAGATDEDDVAHGEDPTSPAPVQVRADLVLLGVPQPLVLLPGDVHEPTPPAYVPEASPLGLQALVDRVLESVRVHAPADATPAVAGDDAEHDVTPTSVREAIRGAAESSNRHGVRWIVAGAIWALAFALTGPMAYKAVVSSADLTIDLFSEQDAAVVEQPAVDVPQDELPPPTDPNDPAEAELTG